MTKTQVLVAGHCKACEAEWRCWAKGPDPKQPCPVCLSSNTVEVLA